MSEPLPMTPSQTNHPAARPKVRTPARWRRALPWLTLVAAATAVIASLRPHPPAVELAHVTRDRLATSILEEGKTRIRHRYLVTAPVAGRLERIPLRAGDRLQAGTTALAVIQPTPSAFLDPRAQEESEARVQMAEATQRLREAHVERARAALDMAEKEKSRATRLEKQGAVSLREYELAVNQVELMTREWHAATFALEVSKFEILQARAAARQAGGSLEDSSSAITLLAPVNGFVLQVFEESARPVTAGHPLLEVGDPTDLEAEIELLSSDAVAVRPGAEVSIEQWGGEQPLRGRVSVIEPGGFTKISALGVEEQRVKVRVDFVEPIPADRALGDRYRVEARILTWQADSVLQVPTGALFRRGNQWMTFRFDRGAAQLAPVTIGHHNGLAAEILSGLTEGQQVILHPPDTLTDGKSVRARAGSDRQP